MKRSTRLLQISRLAEQKEEEAGRELAQSRQAAEHHQQQLQQLKEYRTEYSQPLHGSAEAGVPARQFGDMRRFLNKLNGAIDQQQISVENNNRQLEAKHRTWLETRQRVKALSKAIDKQRQNELSVEQRREQAETDELATRSAFLK